MAQSLPARPNLSYLAKQAKRLRTEFAAGSTAARKRFQASHPHVAKLENSPSVTLSDAQLVIAREMGFDSWAELKRQVERVVLDQHHQANLLVDHCLGGDHVAIKELLEADPSLATHDLWTACALGESDAVLSLLQMRPGLANTAGGPRHWDPLLYVCFSRLLGSAAQRDQAMLKIADALLTHGADPNAFFKINNDPNARQTALYGAAGIANQPDLTALLLKAGADPNDRAPGLGPESLYHAAEFEDHRCLRLILEAGPDPDKVSYCLGRKLDFDDPDGVRLFLEYGADPNFVGPSSGNGSHLHGAIRRHRGAETIELLLEFGADVSLTTETGLTPYALAIRSGHTSAADVLRHHGVGEQEITEVDRFLGACSRAQRDEMVALLEQYPDLLPRLSRDDQQVLPEAAMHGDVAAVRAMLEIGLDVANCNGQRMSPLHWAAWHGNAELTALVLEFRPPLERKNSYGGTPLDAAVYGSVHCQNPQGSPNEADPDAKGLGNYPAVVQMLLAAGADGAAVSPYPSGNADIDAILQAHREVSPSTDAETNSNIHRDVRDMGQFFSVYAPAIDTPASLLDRLTSFAEALVTAHLAEERSALTVIRLAETMPADRPSDAQILETSLSLADAQTAVAKTFLFDSWDAVESVAQRTVDPLFEAAVDAVVGGDLQRLAELLQEQPNLVHAKSPYGHQSNLLHYVAANGVEIYRQRTPPNIAEITRLLLEAGAEADAVNGSYGGGENNTPLCLTVSSGHPAAAGLQTAIVDALLDGHAKIDGRQGDGMPLATALAFGYLETAQLLVKRGASVDNLVTAAGLGRIDLLEALLDESGRLLAKQRYVDPFGPIVTADQELKDRASYAACKTGNARVVAWLLDRGANPGFALMRKETGLHWAAYNGHRMVVETLIEAGADTNARDTQWKAKPIAWAAEGRHRELVSLLEQHTDLDLVEAVSVGALAATQRLLGDTNADGHTEVPGQLLRAAAAHGHLEIVRYLLDRGADPNLRDNEGSAARDLAERHGFPAIVDLLDAET